MALSLTPAAVSQCFALVSLCTSIADPNWIEVENSSTHWGSGSSSDPLIYGVAFTLHPIHNLTNTGPLGGPQGVGLRLLYALAALCYCTVLLSSTAFLFDFLGASRTRTGLSTLLHVFTAVLLLGSLCVCGVCLWMVCQALRQLGDGASSRLGESFYIAALALLFSCLASGCSLWMHCHRVTLSDYMPIEGAEGGEEDLETQYLLKEDKDGFRGVFTEWNA
ncbi:transmembrane protein 127 isoform X2 [Amia ocellicauda]